MTTRATYLMSARINSRTGWPSRSVDCRHARFHEGGKLYWKRSPPSQQPGKRNLAQSYRERVQGAKANLTIPNAITACRLICSPGISYLVLTERYDWAILGVVLAGLSDWADGWIARNVEGQHSVLGSILDPLADKVLVASITIPLYLQGSLPVWICGLIVARDAGLIVQWLRLRGAAATTLEIKPSVISKVNTALQITLLGSSLTSLAWAWPSEVVVLSLSYTVGVTTIMSGLDYYLSTRPQCSK